jgi:ABC-type nitrate/sulfonate/bicarbonate transport systems, periplasmic components
MLLGLVSGCSSSQKDSSSAGSAAVAAKVRFAPIVAKPGTNFLFGVDSGIPAKSGIDLSLVSLDDTNRVSALTSGEVDVAEINTSQAIVAIGKGAPFKIVASMYRTVPAWCLVSQPNIQTVADLKGKKIAISAFGSGFDLAVRQILKAHNLDPDKDVTLLALGGTANQLQAALQTKQVDAIVTSNPVIYTAQKEGFGNVLAKVRDYTPLLHTGVLVATDTFIKEHPDLVTKTIDLYFQSTSYAKQNFDEFIKYAAQNEKLSEDVEKGYQEMDMPVWADDPKVDLEALNWTQDTQIALGFQKEKYDINKVVNFTLIPDKKYE